MEEGVAGVLSGVTARVRAVPLPQEFDGVTEMFPLVLPTVTVTLFVVPPPVCVHPEGKAHV